MTQDSTSDSTQDSIQDTSDRRYEWGEMPMQLTLHWFAPEEPGQPRPVMLSVTTYDDAPLARLVTEAPLDQLLPELQALLAELEQSLAIRQMQWQQRAKKRPPRKPAASQPQTTTTHPTPTVSSTQITLF
jgi:hypothetical protein